MKRIMLLGLTVGAICFAANNQQQQRACLLKKPNGEVVHAVLSYSAAYSVNAAGDFSDQAIAGAPTEQQFFLREDGKLIPVQVICKVTDAQKKLKAAAGKPSVTS